MNDLRGLSDADVARVADALADRLGANGGRTSNDGGRTSGVGRAPRATSAQKKKSRDLKYLTEEETGRLFAAIRASKGLWAERDLALFEVAYHRGLRASEVRLMETGHVQRGRIYTTRLKNGVSNWYVATEREDKALRAWMRVRTRLKIESKALFISSRRRPISRQQLDVLIKAYGKEAGIPQEKCHFHVLRHTSAMTLLNQCEARIEEVQDHLGHVDIRNTMIYARLGDKRREKLGLRVQREW